MRRVATAPADCGSASARPTTPTTTPVTMLLTDASVHTITERGGGRQHTQGPASAISQPAAQRKSQQRTSLTAAGKETKLGIKGDGTQDSGRRGWLHLLTASQRHQLTSHPGSSCSSQAEPLAVRGPLRPHSATACLTPALPSLKPQVCSMKPLLLSAMLPAKPTTTHRPPKRCASRKPAAGGATGVCGKEWCWTRQLGGARRVAVLHSQRLMVLPHSYAGYNHTSEPSESHPPRPAHLCDRKPPTGQSMRPPAGRR
jgi:hypothetical protein